MIFCAVLIWFSAYSVYNSENFQMIRIWQGKACLASVFLPLLLYLGIGIILEKEQEYSWLLLLLADISCCLLSSMGIILACMMLVILLIMGLVRFHSLQSSMYGFVLSAVAASWTCVYYDPIGENNERNNCMDS